MAEFNTSLNHLTCCPVPGMSQHLPLCLCHLLGYFRVQKVVCECFGLCNIYYNETTDRYALAQQRLVYRTFFYNALAWIAVFSHANAECSIDGYIHFIYTVPSIVYLCRRQWLIQVLNEMMGVQRQLAGWLCVSVVRGFLWHLLISVEIVWIICWHLQLYDYLMLLCVPFCVVCCYLQLLLHVNCFIWLYSIYVAMNRMLAAPFSSQRRFKLLQRALQVQPKLQEIQRNMTHYFCVYLLTLFALMLHKLQLSLRQEVDRQGVVILRVQRMQLRYVANHLMLIITLLLALREFRQERKKFDSSLWQLHSKLFLPQLRECHKLRRKRTRQYMDVVDLMLCTGNQPAQLRNGKTLLCQLLDCPIVCASALGEVLLWLLLSMLLVLLLAKEPGWALSWEHESNLKPMFESGNSSIWCLD